MTVATAATTALGLLATVTTLLAVLIVAGRAGRRYRQARRARLAAPARQALLALAGDDADQLDVLVNLDPAVWRAVEPTAVALLGKVRGEAHAALVRVFEQRGIGDRAVRELSARGPVRRARAAEVLGNLGRRDAVPALCALLADRDPDVRAVAARALGRIGEPAAAGALLASLAGRRPVPPQVIADAVIRLGAGAQPALVEALDHDADLVRATAVEVLGLIGAINATARVEEALRRDRSAEVRQRAAATLGRLGTRSALAPLLDAVEPDRAPRLRAVATRALGDLGAVAAAPALGVLLGDPQHEVASTAAYALLRLGATGRATLHAAAGTHPPAAAYAREALAIAELAERRRGGSQPAPAVTPHLPRGG